MKDFNLDDFNRRFRPNLNTNPEPAAQPKGTEIELLLDAKYWNKVFKLLKPSTVIIVKAFRGAGKDKLLPSSAVLIVNTFDNSRSVIWQAIRANTEPKIRASSTRDFSEEGMRVALYNKRLRANLSDLVLEELDKAILQVAVSESLVPESILYEGRRVVEAKQHPPRSTKGFGFIYFVTK